MKKSQGRREITRLNGSAFTVRSCGDGGKLEDFVAEALLRVLGNGADIQSSCTEFTCNLYAPPPQF
jgi:hypothetical protein